MNKWWSFLCLTLSSSVSWALFLDLCAWVAWVLVPLLDFLFLGSCTPNSPPPPYPQHHPLTQAISGSHHMFHTYLYFFFTASITGLQCYIDLRDYSLCECPLCRVIAFFLPLYSLFLARLPHSKCLINIYIWSFLLLNEPVSFKPLSFGVKGTIYKKGSHVPDYQEVFLSLFGKTSLNFPVFTSQTTRIGPIIFSYILTIIF